MNPSSRLGRFVCPLAFVLGASAACAQDVIPYIKSTTAELKPVEFKAGLSELGLFGSISNQAFKPAGKSPPFPAVVVGHACGGVNRPHILERMKELLDAGFAVLALDTFGPRGLEQCRGQSRIRSTATVMDAYGALAHLASLGEIDASRIYFTGYSWGGVVAPQLASPQSAEAFASKLRYRAVVSNYGGCSIQPSPSASRIYYLLNDTDRPVLMLMASEDKEFKVAECVPVLEALKASGKPVYWHVYAGIHHAWDQRDLYHYTVTTGWNETNLYRYNSEATVDSTKRMIDFFNAHR